jgi:hypothetical protein
MDGSDRLKGILARCRWVADEQGLLARVPELNDQALPVESWPIGQTGEQWVTPLTGIAHLAGRVVETMEQSKTEDVSSFLFGPSSVVGADGLVSQLRGMLAHTSPVQVHRVAMGLAHLSSRMLQNRGMGDWMEPAVARRASTLVSTLAAMGPSERTIALTRISDAISARLSAALTMGGHPTHGIVRRLIANRLVWVMGHDDGQIEADLGLVAGVFGIGIDGTVVSMISGIAQCALEDSGGRQGGRKERPADIIAERLCKDSVGSPLFHPTAGPALVRLLPMLIDGRSLKGRISDHKRAARFLEPSAIRPVSGAWADFVEQLAAWDVLSAAIGGIQLVSRVDGSWRMDQTTLKHGVHWSLRVPRADPKAHHAVVACRFGALLGHGGVQPDIRRAIHNRWTEMLPSNCVHSWCADHGIAAFTRTSDAIRFALGMNQQFVDADGMLPTSSDPISLVPGRRVPIGVSVGPVVGGTDGAMAWLDGPAVSEAIHLAGREPLERSKHDPLWIRRVSSGDWGLASSGVCCSRAAATDAWNAWGSDVHRYGDGSDVAGIGTDFNVVPVDGWAKHVDGAALFISLGPNRGGPILEVLSMDLDALRDLHLRDSQLGQGDGMVTEHGLASDDEPPSEGSRPQDQGDVFGFGESAESTGSEARDDEQWKGFGFGDESGSER